MNTLQQHELDPEKLSRELCSLTPCNFQIKEEEWTNGPTFVLHKYVLTSVPGKVFLFVFGGVVIMG